MWVSVTDRVSESMNVIANEPSLAFYRIQEHVRKCLPQLAETKVDACIILFICIQYILSLCKLVMYNFIRRLLELFLSTYFAMSSFCCLFDHNSHVNLKLWFVLFFKLFNTVRKCSSRKHASPLIFRSLHFAPCFSMKYRIYNNKCRGPVLMQNMQPSKLHFKV